MKKYTKSAFTLVELIVVITILAILATVAFISFGGQTTKAKNSKVVSDVSQLESKINLLSIDTPEIVTNALSGAISTNEVSGTGAGIVLNAGTNYDAGTINFYKIKEDHKKFMDTTDPENPKDYLYGYVSQKVTGGNVNVFNVAGQTKDETGKYTTVLRGTYYKAADDNVDSLISPQGSTTPIVNDQDLGADKLY